MSVVLVMSSDCSWVVLAAVVVWTAEVLWQALRPIRFLLEHCLRQCVCYLGAFAFVSFSWANWPGSDLECR